MSTVRKEDLRRGDGRRRAIEVLREDWRAHQPQPWRRPSFHALGGLDHGGGSPRLGKGVRSGAGAVVAEEIEIGDGVTIGPNAVVTTDIPAGATVLAPPARIVAARPETGSPPPGVHGSRVPPTADAVVALVSETLDLSAPVGADTPLFSSGLVDSLNVALLLDVIESHFGVAVPPEKVAASEFDTAREIAALLSTPE